MVIVGTGAASGIGIGKAVIIRNINPEVVKSDILDVEAEKKRFLEVLEVVKSETSSMVETLAERVGEKEAAILEGHMLLMSDPALIDEILKIINSESVNAEFAVERVCDLYANMFAGMDDELMQQRAADMRDIKVRLIKSLLGIRNVDIADLSQGSILVATDLTPSMTSGLDPKTIYGIVTELGGRTSHSAILARALEIPAIVACKDVIEKVKDGDLICFNGDKGEVYINPDKNIEENFLKEKEHFLKEKKDLESYKGKESVTKDGHKVELVANIGNSNDATKALEYDAEGIGLFRTEFLFMDRSDLPSEEEQFEAYKRVATTMKGKPVIIRTLDIGGDKEIDYLGIEKDENPFLGYRAIRLCLDRYEDLYRPQLLALLRASAFGDIRIMIPFITCVDELRKAKELIESLKKELDKKGIAYNKNIKVGIMIETAAASIIADILAKEADFFSIGTNDLTQYTMAVDRGNDKVSYLYSTYNPAVLRSIRNIILAAKKEGIPVGMCGEAAADELILPLLLAWGLDEFSMSASSILRIRKRILNYTVEEANDIANKALEFVTEEEIRAYLKSIC